MLGGARRIMLRNIGDNVFQIVFSVFGNNDLKRH
jgi:hypothetical protein